MEEISRGTSHQYERERDEYEWNGFPVWLSPNQFYICIRICRTRGVSNKGSLIFSSFSVALHCTHPPRCFARWKHTSAQCEKKKECLATAFRSPGRLSAARTPKYVTINCVSVRARVFARVHHGTRLFPAHYRTRAGTRNTFKCVISVWSFIKIPTRRLRSIFALRRSGRHNTNTYTYISI